jgi:S1-C subfamily serine protease
MSTQNRTSTNETNTLSGVKIYEKIHNSVIKIENFNTDSREISGNRIPIPSSGSGIVLDRNGLIVTNYHVIDDYPFLEIINDELIGDENIVLIGFDKVRDIAFLRANNPAFEMIPIELGDSSKVKIGEEIYCIGSSMEHINTFSKGIISSIRRGFERGSQYDFQRGEFLETDNKNYIQFTASISPGNSGGALVNNKGELIGIPVHKFEGDNLNYAIPVNDIKKLMNKVKNIRNDNLDLFFKADLASIHSDYQMALKYNNKLIRRKYRKLECYFQRGKIYYSLGKNILALRNFSKAIKSRKLKADVYLNKAILYTNTRNFSKALRNFNAAIKTNSKIPEYYLKRAYFYGINQEYRKAINDFKKTIKFDKNNFEALCGLGDIYLTKRNPVKVKAVEYYTKCIEKNNKYFRAYTGLFNCFSDTERHSKVEIYKIAAEKGYEVAQEWLINEGYTY